MSVALDVFAKCVEAVQQGELIESISAKDKEFHFQNWFQKRLEAVAAYPVYGELSVSSPKSSTKKPISLDAILVCKKGGNEEAAIIDIKIDIKKAEMKAEEFRCKLKSAGIETSESDEFVILASQILAHTSDASMSFDDMKDLLQEIVMPNNAHALACLEIL